MTTWNGVRTGTAVIGVALAAWTAPMASAVAPPPIDQSLLPLARPPAPPGATESVGPCQPAHAVPRPTHVGQSTKLDVRSAWPLSRGAGQTVAVIDTGVSRHRLLPRLVAGGDYVATRDGLQDCDGHGTAVAGIVAAAATGDDPEQFAGVAPDATILAIRQSSNEFRLVEGAGGQGVGDVDTLAMSIRTAADLGATVVNVSSVACVPAAAGLADGALGAALAYAVDVKNVVIVAAAGNVGPSGQCPEQNPTSDPVRPGRPDWDRVAVVVSPSWYDDYVLTVGSVGADGRPSKFTVAGPWVDVAAPGEAVVSLSADGDGLTDPMEGTSYAAPVVSGLAALIRSRAPLLSARQVMRRIEDTAQHPSAGWDPLVGAGLVDPQAALSDDGADRPPQTLGGAPASAPEISSSADSSLDRGRRGVALWGAAACLAVVSGAALSTGWLRRRESVPRD